MLAMNEKPSVSNKCLEEVYDIRQKIGDGHFADVNLCIHCDTQKAFAAKFIVKQRLTSSRTYGEVVRGSILKDIDREAYILANLKHENIVKLHEVFYQDESVVLILDLVTGGELFARVAECERLSEEEASNFVEQILFGVQHMHSLGVVHLDLKPENIMIEDLASRKIKIIDFGLARLLNPNETFQDLAGTPEFCAPEIVTYDPITFATDMWAIGVITYILLSGISPFAGDSQMETFQNILSCIVDYDREEIREATDLAKDFIHQLLVKNPKKRSTANQCLEHPWIKPCDTAQSNYRRVSLIRKQNLDGLRHFIAYPSPPSSPVALTAATNNSINNSCGNHFENAFAMSEQAGDKMECNPVPNALVPSLLEPDREIGPCVDDVQSDDRKGTIDPSKQQHNNRHMATKREAKRKNRNNGEQKFLIQQHQQYQQLRVDKPDHNEAKDHADTTFMNSVQISQKSEALNCDPAKGSDRSKHISTGINGLPRGNRRTHFGSSLIERLGAAFTATTLQSHSPANTQNSNKKSSRVKAVLPQTNELVTSMYVSSQIEEQSFDKRMCSSKYQEQPHQHSVGERKSFSHSVSQKPDKVSPVPSQSEAMPLTLQELGSSTRSSKPHELALQETVCNGVAGDGPNPKNKSHSLTQTTESKLWSMRKTEYNHWSHKQPNRIQVGRLQQLFENRTGQSNWRLNGPTLSQRFSQS